MSFLGLLFGRGKKSAPVVNPIRETLFGDMPLAEWPPDESVAQVFPWSAFVEARTQLAAGQREAALDCWRQVIAHSELEPRQHLQAWHFLNQQGEHPPAAIARQLLGLVVEVGMPKGLDVLAAYPDHTARYYNFSGGGIVWEHPDSSLDAAIDELLAAGQGVVGQIGLWNQPRPSPPQRDHARMSFLTPSGLHFGQGPMAVLSRDPVGGRTFYLASKLMAALVAKTAAR